MPTFVTSPVLDNMSSFFLAVCRKAGTRGSFLFLFFCKRRSPPLGVEVTVMAQTMARHLARHLAAYLVHPKGIRMVCQRFEIRLLGSSLGDTDGPSFGINEVASQQKQ